MLTKSLFQFIRSYIYFSLITPIPELFIYYSIILKYIRGTLAGNVMKYLLGTFAFSFIFLFLGVSLLYGQERVNRISNSTLQRVITKQNNLSANPSMLSLDKLGSLKQLSEHYSSLHFIGAQAIQQGEFQTEGSMPGTLDSNTIKPGKPESKNWTKQLIWTHIPKHAVSGRYEISLTPFPPQYDPGFSGTLHWGIIPTHGVDSLNFNITYTDKANGQVVTRIKPVSSTTNASRYQKVEDPSNTTGSQPIAVTKIPPNLFRKKNNSSENNDTKINIPSGLNLNLNMDKCRTFYIRIIPFDASGNALPVISNEITLREVIHQESSSGHFQQKAPSIADDYTITSFKYIPVRPAQSNYFGCGIVTGYLTDMNNPLMQSLATQYPIGSLMCPKPPTDNDAWYEKAFNSTAGFIIKSIDGAADVYNDTKNYIKKKFIELNCNANLVTTVVNPVSKLQEAAGPDVCDAIAGAAFDYGMIAVGLPPSLPSSDDLKLMAEGQIIDLACDQLESETGLPVPDAAREKLRQEFHDQVSSAANQGSVNGGFVKVKPHPLGQFQTAYLEMEITRTGHSFNGKQIATFDVSAMSSGIMSVDNKANGTTSKIPLNGRLFETAWAQVPYLDHVGDKIKIYLALKPQASFVNIVYGSSPEFIAKSATLSTQCCGNVEPFYPPATYEGYATTWGFTTLSSSGFTTQFLTGLKTAPGVQLNFPNK